MLYQGQILCRFGDGILTREAVIGTPEAIKLRIGYWALRGKASGHFDVRRPIAGDDAEARMRLTGRTLLCDHGWPARDCPICSQSR